MTKPKKEVSNPDWSIVEFKYGSCILRREFSTAIVACRQMSIAGSNNSRFKQNYDYVAHSERMEIEKYAHAFYNIVSPRCYSNFISIRKLIIQCSAEVKIFCLIHYRCTHCKQLLRSFNSHGKTPCDHLDANTKLRFIAANIQIPSDLAISLLHTANLLYIPSQYPSLDW